MSKFVYDSTIRNNVPGALSDPGQSVVCKVGRHKILVSRREKLDKYGNLVHISSVIGKDGIPNKPYSSNGGAQHSVAGALKKSGIGIRYRKKK